MKNLDKIMMGISIHVPREGDDSALRCEAFSGVLFQSTSPVRGTTEMAKDLRQKAKISIHVPREGDDWRGRPWSTPQSYFNPRPP